MLANVVSALKMIFNFIKIFWKNNEEELMRLLWDFLMSVVNNAREKKKTEPQQTT
ncbi:hypothetical protein [Bacillus sp. AFS073361]|uniref:hypothetical protein n=1 Tax=Bacillus sp. AFS073361 TaxID=2033511 RepID=UPI0015D4E4A9|nr:hypothetical protein [Bacillus sp. AFS073361]